MATTTCTNAVIAPSARWVGSAAASTALLLIGTAAPVAATVHRIPLLVGQGLRYLAASLVLLMILSGTGRLRRARPRSADLPRIAVLGAIGIAGFTICFVAATRYAAPAVVGAVLSATPVLLAIIGPVLDKRRPAARVVIGSVVIALGTLIGTGSGSAGLLGILLCLGALCCEVGFSLLAVPLVDRYGPMITTGYASMSGAVFLLVPAVAIDGWTGFATIGRNPEELPALGFLAVMISIGANLSWYTALRRIGTDRAGLFYAWTPIGALVASLVLTGSSPAPMELIGVAVVIIGLLTGLGLTVRRNGRPGATEARDAGIRPVRGRSSLRSGRC